MTEWQPIETAPKDGTGILAWDSYDDHTVVFWSEKARAWVLNVPGSYCADRTHTFTHWMPLPSSPQKEQP